MADVTEEPIVWRGAEALRPFLVPIVELAPFEGNPRRGDVEEIRESLRRFGQTRPILTDAKDARLTVAGHHVTIAAAEEGYTHVAAIPNEFENEDEARAYLHADNRTHDRGGYDLEALYSGLRAVQATDAGLVGTGYDDAYLDRLRRDLDAAAPAPPPEFPPLDPDALETSYCCPSCRYEWSGDPKPGAPPAEPPAE